MTEPSSKSAQLDELIRAEATDLVGDGEVIVSWLVVAATRSYDGGGAVLTLGNDDSMPQWQARGMLDSALRMVDRSEDADQEPGQ